MLELLQKGGPLMLLLFLCSIVALGVFLERLFYLHRISLRVGEFLQGIALLLERDNITQALEECSLTPGPVAHILRAVLQRPYLARHDLKEVASDVVLLELPKLERNLSILSTIAYVAPLMGLLGTILGFLDTFLTISTHSSYATTDQIARGVFEALITTAAGVAIAIPAFIAYSYLASRINDLLHDMERAGIEMIQLLLDYQHRDQGHYHYQERLKVSSNDSLNEEEAQTAEVATPEIHQAVVSSTLEEKEGS